MFPLKSWGFPVNIFPEKTHSIEKIEFDDFFFSRDWPCKWWIFALGTSWSCLFYRGAFVYLCISRMITIQLGLPITNQGLGSFPTGLRFRRRRREFTNITRDPINTNATSSIRERSNRVIDLDKLWVQEKQLGSCQRHLISQSCQRWWLELSWESSQPASFTEKNWLWSCTEIIRWKWAVTV